MNRHRRPAPCPGVRPVRGPAGAVLLAVVVLGALTACGADDEQAADPAASSASSASAEASESSSAAPEAPDAPEVPAGTPDCDDVWSEGATIPRRYAGCVAAGALVEDDSLACSSGQRLVTYDDRFYGVAGGEVRVADEALVDDRDYVQSVRSCRA